MKKILLNQFQNNYIIDIRDHNKIINFFNISKVVQKSKFVTLSSDGYKKWLPKQNKYLINHNTRINSLKKLRKINKEWTYKDITSIAYIGAVRDYQINVDFIKSTKGKRNLLLNFHGKGNINEKLQSYLNKNNIQNVNMTGIYNENEEEELYLNNDLINVFRYKDGVNNETALPNRLYNAPLYGRPLLALEGTYLSEVIKDNNLGLVVPDFGDIDKQIIEYKKRFNIEKYQQSRISFFESVIKDNNNFKNEIKNFLKNK